MFNVKLIGSDDGPALTPPGEIGELRVHEFHSSGIKKVIILFMFSFSAFSVWVAASGG
jgi:hypothetical protein